MARSVAEYLKHIDLEGCAPSAAEEALIRNVLEFANHDVKTEVDSWLEKFYPLLWKGLIPHLTFIPDRLHMEDVLIDIVQAAKREAGLA